MNHGSGGRSGKGGRQVTEDEADLWRQLAHSVDKVKAKPRVATHGLTDDAFGGASAPVASPVEQQGKRARQRPATAAAALPVAPAARVRQPPPPADFDRRTLRQVAAGKVTIDGVLDLHGLRQDAAHARLRAFLMSSQAKGLRMLLVITGKGGGAGVEPGGRPLEAAPRSYRERGGAGSDPTTRGVLRRSVPLWLDEPELRAVVVGYASAGARHGGDGALYIRLRKARDA
jgi:DNA-nicking Smr family endonuclease